MNKGNKVENENEVPVESNDSSGGNLVTNDNNATVEKLKQFIARIERLEAEKAEISDDIKEVYSEVGVFGFDKKIVRKVISRRKKTKEELAEEDMMIQNYTDHIEGNNNG